MSMAIATRFFAKTNPEENLPRIQAFLDASTALTDKVLVAVNIDDDNIGSLEFVKRNYPGAVSFPVTPWGFTSPLNAAVRRAVEAGATKLLIASAEFPPEEMVVKALIGHLDDNTLVAGTRFAEHEFTEGEVKGTGVTVPWNTFAVWNLRLLGRLGLPLCGDSPFDSQKAGVEEVSTIALYQQLYDQAYCQAKLVTIPGFFQEWNTVGWDPDRLAKHVAKIASKVGRPAAQLEWAGLPAPKIIHIA